MVDNLSAKRSQIVADPCNRTAVIRNWQQTIQQLGDIINKLNEVINVINVTNVTDYNTIINNIVNNEIFQNSVNSYIANYLTNYFASQYANIITFTLDTELALSMGTWQASATVGTSWMGLAPAATVTVLDPAAKWRWMAYDGAPGIAIRANNAGTQYIILDVAVLAPVIRGIVYADFTTADQAFEGTISKLFMEPGNPITSTSFTSPLKIGNPPHSGGNYRFEGSTNALFEAVIVYSASKPANTLADPPYVCLQIECP